MPRPDGYLGGRRYAELERRATLARVELEAYPFAVIYRELFGRVIARPLPLHPDGRKVTR